MNPQAVHIRRGSSGNFGTSFNNILWVAFRIASNQRMIWKTNKNCPSIIPSTSWQTQVFYITKQLNTIMVTSHRTKGAFGVHFCSRFHIILTDVSNEKPSYNVSLFDDNDNKCGQERKPKVSLFRVRGCPFLCVICFVLASELNVTYTTCLFILFAILALKKIRWTWYRVYKKIMLNTTEHKLILLINVYMLTVVGILTLMSRINYCMALTTNKSS